jgi:hypothetical protein
VAGQQRLPAVALGAALASALAVGLVLAVVLPGVAALSAGWGERWRALVQVHGHVMVVGWAGFFVIGMGVRLLPRFSSTPLQLPRLPAAAFALLAAALALRSIAQPLADAQGARALLPLSGALETVGAACFTASAVATLRRPLRERRVWAYFLAAGALWFVAEAALTTWALARLWGNGEMIVAPADDAPALHAQFLGFLLCFIVGVALRSVPVFHAWKPPAQLQWSAWSLLQAGAAVVVLASLLSALGVDARLLAEAGRLVVCLALLACVACMGVWRPASRLRGGVRPAAALLRSTFTWLAVAGLLFAYAAVRGMAKGTGVPDYLDDAARHTLALGVVTVMIVAMAFLTAPMLAQERVGGRAAALRVYTLATLLDLAVVLRVSGAMLEGAGIAQARYWPMAAAGVLALLAIALFAQRVISGVRHPYVPLVAVREE